MDPLIRHHVRIFGAGRKRLVFGHGMGTDQRIWRLLAPRFAADHQVVLLDWLGCGQAARGAFTERHASLRGHSSDLCELVAAQGDEPVLYVGHSAGGMIGVLAAIQRPELFEKLVLIAASPRYLDDPPGYRGGLQEAEVDALLTLLDENFATWSNTLAAIAAKDAELELELAGIFRENDPGHLREFVEAVLRSDFRDDLPRSKVPVLVLASARDDMVPIEVSEYLHRRLIGSSYRCLDLAGHCPQMTHPQLVEAAIRDYLQPQHS